MGDNRVRVFTEVCQLDAWHSPVNTEGNTKVHVELSFGIGRIGGDDSELDFTFRVRLRKAVLSVRLSPPLKAIRSGVARSVPEAQITHTRVRQAKDTINKEGKADVALTPSRLAATLSGSISNAQSKEFVDHLQLVQQLPHILVATVPTDDAGYAWSLEPTFSPHLDGQPWDPINAPRLVVRDYPTSPRIEPVIEARLTCLKEDLVIDDIQIKNAPIREAIANVIASDLKMKAAEQYIRRVLTEINLEPSAMDNRFSKLILASAIAAVEYE